MISGFGKRSETSSKIDLVELLSSEGKPEKISKKLIKALKINPSHTHNRYVLNRSIFHYIVMKQQVASAKAVLEDIQLSHLALLLDRNQQHVLHYAVQKQFYSREMVELLINELPSLVHEKNKRGETALHIAVKHGLEDAIKLLVTKGKSNPEELDNAGRSAREIASNNASLMAALMAIDLQSDRFHEKFPALDTNRVPPMSIKDLSAKFSAIKLSPAESSGERASSSGGRTSSRSSNLESSSSDTYLIRDNSTEEDSLLSYDTKSTQNLTLSVSDSHSSFQASTSVESNSCHSLLCSSDRASSSTAPLSISLQDLRNGDLEVLRHYLANGGDPNKKVFARRTIIAQAFILATAHPEATSKVLKDQFYFLLEHSRLMFSNEKSSFIDFARNRHGSLALLHEGARMLQARRNEVRIFFQDVLKKNIIKFERVLFESGLGKVQPPELMKKSYSILGESLNIPEDIVEVLDLLCAGTTKDVSFRSFDKALVSASALGLQNFIEPHVIIRYLACLAPHFDLSQNLIANLIVKELLEWDISHQYVDTIKFSLALKRLYVSNEAHTPSGKLINECLKQIIKTKVEENRNIIVENYHCLQQCTQSHVDIQSLRSIETIIHAGLQSEESDRVVIAKQFANEIRLFGQQLYQNLQINEFFNKAWSRGKKLETSPNICKQIDFYTRMTNCIADKILSLPSQDVAQGISFFIQVGHATCYSEEGFGPDLNGLMCISGALDKLAITRLKPMIAGLPPAEQILLTNITELASAAHNYKWQRQFMQTWPNAVPFLGIFTKDVTMSIDGNSDKLGLIGVLGKTFRQILMLKKMLSNNLVAFETDMVHVLTQGSPMMDADKIEELQYRASCRIVPLSSEKPLILDKIKTIQKLFEKLTEIVGNEFIPHVIKFKSKEYTFKDCIRQIIILFHGLNRDEPVEAQRTNAMKMKLYVDALYKLSVKDYHVTPNKFLLYNDLFSPRPSVLPFMTQARQQPNNNATSSVHAGDTQKCLKP
tara:strand:- start:65606 stop:68599 length:2994 start_codon:yes stop_codon:yes gene_type:complete